MIVRIIFKITLLSIISVPVFANKNLPAVKENLKNIREKINGVKPEYNRLKEENKLLKRELTNLSERLVIITEKINITEDNISSYESDIKALDATEKELLIKLQTGKSETSKILSAMGRLSLSPSSPLGTMEDELKEVQAGILLKSLNRSLKQKADELVKDIETLSQMREDIRIKRRNIHSEKVTLAADRNKLEILLDERQKRFKTNNAGLKEKKKYIAELSKKQTNITHLIEQIQKQKEILARKKQEEAIRKKRIIAKKENPKEVEKSISVASLENSNNFFSKGSGGVLSSHLFQKEKGKLKMPTSGRVIYGFGGRDLTGKIRKGMTIRTRPSSIVSSPSQGEVIFVGKFRDYGHMVIVKPSNNYHILVAGLGKTHVTLGQNIIKGEPLGRMPTGAGSRNLYLEMRKNKRPIDPAVWLKRYRQLARK